MTTNLKQGDRLSLRLRGQNPLSENSADALIIVNDGPGWNEEGFAIFLRKTDQNDVYIISSIIKEQGPAVAMSTKKCLEYVQAIEKQKAEPSVPYAYSRSRRYLKDPEGKTQCPHCGF